MGTNYKTVYEVRRCPVFGANIVCAVVLRVKGRAAKGFRKSK
jgi:hypothetical protein